MSCQTDATCCDPRPLQTPGGVGSSDATSSSAGPRGRQGDTGATGADGADGNRTIAFVGTGGFTMPAENASVDIPIDETIELSGSYWIVPGLIIHVEDAGYFQVTAVTSSTVTATNLGYSANATPGVAIDEGVAISPGAPRGSDALPQSRLYVQLEQRETTGTHGGTFTQGAYRPRLLNNEVYDIGDLLLALDPLTGIFQLKGGYIYEFEAGAPAFDVHGHRVRLRNVDTSEVFNGTSEFSSSAGGQTESICAGRFELAVDTNFVLEHRCEQTQASNGMGRAAGFGDDMQNYERFAWIKIWAVATS